MILSILRRFADACLVAKVRSLEEEIKDLETRLKGRESELAVAKLENELLGELNENLRRWLLANTAAAVQEGRHKGVADNENALDQLVKEHQQQMRR